MAIKSMESIRNWNLFMINKIQRINYELLFENSVNEELVDLIDATIYQRPNADTSFYRCRNKIIDRICAKFPRFLNDFICDIGIAVSNLIFKDKKITMQNRSKAIIFFWKCVEDLYDFEELRSKM